MTVIAIVIGGFSKIIKELVPNGDHPNESIIQNTKKSLGDLRRLAVTQTPVETIG